MCKCQLAHRPHHAHGARSSGSWDISPQSPTSARPATYRRSISVALAACATKLSMSVSCGTTRKAAGCATAARRKRGHTDAPPATSTNLLLNSSIAGESSKLLSTPAARAARRAWSASVASPTTAPWQRTRDCARSATLWPTAKSARYATGHLATTSSLHLNGLKEQGRESVAVGI